ncbi:MAG: hypothetical protein HDR50_06735 [Desulfovibrio sp.]|uniref:hypothetical protein n=1 Tax=Desulfovibrio sp. TaxID=885 RepID=UPI001A7398FD|nr:hypothetical protein [Desulfovibrio sp.]MBD5417344.1 hypothetical protein [Desulfovibrio sp.]
MDERFFDSMLDEIYSAFQRQRPTRGTPAYRSLWRRVCEERAVPNEAAKAIAYALTDRDSLPLNLGKAILAEFENWLADHPQRRAKATACRDCDPAIPGFFWVWDATGYRMLCKCACNQDRRLENMQAWTRRQAQEAGLLLTDPGVEPAPRTLPPPARKALGHTEPPRRDHVAQREYSNAGGW